MKQELKYQTTARRRRAAWSKLLFLLATLFAVGTASGAVIWSHSLDEASYEPLWLFILGMVVAGAVVCIGLKVRPYRRSELAR